ncbi:MAG: hypothetical protein RL332_932 [Actinomycetota bacterium]
MIQEAHWEQARSQAYESWKKLPAEVVSIDACLDRTLAKDVIALVELPTYPTLLEKLKRAHL